MLLAAVRDLRIMRKLGDLLTFVLLSLSCLSNADIIWAQAENQPQNLWLPGSLSPQTSGPGFSQQTRPLSSQFPGSLSSHASGSLSAQPSGPLSPQLPGLFSAQSFRPFSAQPSEPFSAQQPRPLSQQLPGLSSVQPSGRLSLQPTGPLSAQPSESLSAQAAGLLSAQQPRPLSQQLSGLFSAQPSGSLSVQPTGPLSAQSSGSLSVQPTGPLSGLLSAQQPRPLSSQLSGPVLPQQPRPLSPQLPGLLYAPPSESLSAQAAGSLSAQQPRPLPQQLSGLSSAQPSGSLSVQPTGPLSAQSSGSLSVQPTGPLSGLLSAQQPRPLSSQLSGPVLPQQPRPLSPQLTGLLSAQPSGPLYAQPFGPLSAQPSGPLSALPSGPLSGPLYAQPSGPVPPQQPRPVLPQAPGQLFPQISGNIYPQLPGALVSTSYGPQMQLTDSAKCQLDNVDKVPCGDPGMDASHCGAINCCFDGQQCYYGKTVTVQCTIDGQFVLVAARDTTLPRISLDSITLLGGSDGPCGVVDYNADFAIYQFPVTACGTRATVQGDYVVYENKMVSSYEVGVGPLGAITRDSHYELYFQCRYSTTSVESLAVALSSNDPPLPVVASGPLRVELRLGNGQCVTKGCVEEQVAYTSYYTEAEYPVTKVLREPVYVEVRMLARTDPNLVLVLGRCWATSTPDSNSVPQWDLLVNGCPYREDRYLTNMVPVNGSSGLQYPNHYKRFVLKMFTFVDPSSMAPLRERVFIHCNTAVCSPTAGVTCEPRCNRRRRDVGSSVKHSRPVSVVSSGEVIYTDLFSF